MRLLYALFFSFLISFIIPLETRAAVSIHLVDVNNSADSIQYLAQDAFKVMDIQGLALDPFKNTCLPEESTGACYRIFTDLISVPGNFVTNGGGAIGYNFTDTLSSSIAIGQTLKNHYPSTYSGNDAFLASKIRWQPGGLKNGFYIATGFSLSRSSANISRPVNGYTENGKGSVNTDGVNISLEIGHDIYLSTNNLLSLISGLGSTRLYRDAYTEKNVYFPFSYKKINTNNNYFYLGADFEMQLINNLKWISKIKFKHDLTNTKPKFESAGVTGTDIVTEKVVNNRGQISTGIEYSLSKNLALSIEPNVSKTLIGDYSFGGTLSVKGNFN